MKRARFTEEQIIGILRENEAGAKAGDLARKHGVSEGAIYAWKARFGGMYCAGKLGIDPDKLNVDGGASPSAIRSG